MLTISSRTDCRGTEAVDIVLYPLPCPTLSSEQALTAAVLVVIFVARIMDSFCSWREVARHRRMTSAQEIRDRLEGYARAKIASVMQPLTEELLVDQVLRAACHARGGHRAHRSQRVTCLRPSVGNAAGLQCMLSRAAADT